ncbi:MAG: hypothetical protein GF383_08445 [Candidatus Lokiarchaeota archaeon]|nr:hypothetical protein [Candidatus Lokiarchaeota archaeon]MBD3340388.1 hypothetical protein [Candidatus Lokiarchaeota archaeon]
MSNQNSDNEKKENPFLKGWNDFTSGLKKGFEDFQKTLEEQSKKNLENWEESKQKVGKFFNNVKDDWEGQLNAWQQDMERIQLENKEQWEAKKRKIEQDFERWQDQTRKDWKDGVKSWNRSVIKGAYMFLIVMIPIIIVLVLVIWVITQFLNLVPG